MSYLLSSFIQQNEVEINDETNNENANVAVAREYMALREVTRSQGGSAETETSPYLEINEYAPLHPSTRSWEVPRENVIIEKVIGQGAFGQVAQGTASQLRGREGTTTVAIKMLKGTSCFNIKENTQSDYTNILWSRSQLSFKYFVQNMGRLKD